MKTRQYSLVFIATALQLALTNQSTLAFSITGNKEVQNLKYTLPVRGKEQDARYAPLKIFNGMGQIANIELTELAPPDETTGFMQRLKTEFPDWNFKPAQKSLYKTQSFC